MTLFAADFSRPDRWIEAALTSEVTPIPPAAGAFSPSAAHAVVRHCMENRALYEDPCSNEEAAHLLRRLGLAPEKTSAVPGVDTTLLVEALSEAQEWFTTGENELAWSAARDALMTLEVFADVKSGVESLDVATRLLEALCARVLGYRGGEALLSNDSALSLKACLLLDLVAAGTAAYVDRPSERISHLLAARIYRSRFAQLKGFVRPYRRLTATIATARTLRSSSLLGAECVEALQPDIHLARLSDRLTATAQLYLSETLPNSTQESCSAAFG